MYHKVKQHAEELNISHRIPLNTENILWDEQSTNSRVWNDWVEMHNIRDKYLVNRVRAKGDSWTLKDIMDRLKILAKEVDGYPLFENMPNLYLSYPKEITKFYLHALRDMVKSIIYDDIVHINLEQTDHKINQRIEYMYNIIVNNSNEMYKSCSPKYIEFENDISKFFDL